MLWLNFWKKTNSYYICRVKNDNIFAHFLGENLLKIITSVPGILPFLPNLVKKIRLSASGTQETKILKGRSDLSYGNLSYFRRANVAAVFCISKVWLSVISMFWNETRYKCDQGPMLWFLKYFRRKIQHKSCRFWLKTKLNYAKFWSKHRFSRKTPIFSPKIVEYRRKL
jgi:hypothetical protein